MQADDAAAAAAARLPRAGDRSASAEPLIGSVWKDLRLIGIVEAPRSGRVAVLADAAGVHHGQLGDAVDGRYRIVAFENEAVQVEAVQVEDIASRVRITLRLSGSGVAH